MATHAALYPLPSVALLREKFVGKSLKDVETPAAIIDRSITKRNCQNMLAVVEELGFGWRAHIKTHKTAELTRLQLGTDISKPANIVVSTINEGEFILPVLKDYQKYNLLYGLPPGLSSIPRLSSLATELGPGSLSLLIDHVDQLPVIQQIRSKSGMKPLIFIKIDMGGHRAGVTCKSATSTKLFTAVVAAHTEGYCILHGLYSHAGQSYGGSSQAEAMNFLRRELHALFIASIEITSLSQNTRSSFPETQSINKLVLSVGATPTTTSIRNLLRASLATGDVDIPNTSEETKAITFLREILDLIKNAHHKIELHAGVYPLLDMQQIATSALPSTMLSEKDIGLTILAEVLSLYPDRTDTPSVLIGAGTLALGRETCKSYTGYGMLSPYNISLPSPWKISYVSQEHGILTPVQSTEIELSEPGVMIPADVIVGAPIARMHRENALKEFVAFEVGQKLRVWPNHACIASSGFGWYLIIDSELEEGGDVIVDVWVRVRGW